MTPPEDADLQQRMQRLMQEAEARFPATNAHPAAVQQPPQQRKRYGPALGSSLALGLALLVGIQLGALPWRFRRELWLAQGLVIGLGLGLTIGRLTADRSRRD